MKKLILTLCAAALILGLNAQDVKKDAPKTTPNVAGQTDPTVTPPPAPNTSPTAPELSFENDVHDFMTLPKGAPCEYEFKFKNTGKEPLIIQNAQAS